MILQLSWKRPIDLKTRTQAYLSYNYVHDRNTNRFDERKKFLMVWNNKKNNIFPSCME